MLLQILLNAVQVAHRQGNVLTFHVEADEDDRAGQVVLARQLQHLLGVVWSAFSFMNRLRTTSAGLSSPATRSILRFEEQVSTRRSVFSQLERETIAERIRDNMHELAKTGRWLGGTTPTGYASESVKSITVDGKTKKAYKLKLLPDEAEIIYKIFDLYEQYDSLTMTETELLRQGIKTKTGRSFTRFSIKSILQNPVYLIADKDAYQYFAGNCFRVVHRRMYCFRHSINGNLSGRGPSILLAQDRSVA